MPIPEDFDTNEFIRRVLAEDLGTGGDVTSNATIAADARFTAEMNCRQAIVLAGLDLTAAFFRALDPEIEIEQLAKDGDRLGHGAVLMRLAGNARAMLTAERSALNTLQHLSGIATLQLVSMSMPSTGPARSCSTRARHSPAYASSRNMRHAWAVPRTTACGWMTAC